MAENEKILTPDTVHRVTASPRYVKTQTAKISYASTERRLNDTKVATIPFKTVIQKLPKVSVRDHSMRSPERLDARKTSPKTSQKDFIELKDERDKEIQEIKSTLYEILKSSPKLQHLQSKIPEQRVINDKLANAVESIENKENFQTKLIPRTFRRCKTDFDLVSAKPVTSHSEQQHKRDITTRKRSHSSHPPPKKIYDLFPDSAAPRKKSYNPEDARRFMEEQKKKRRLNIGNEMLLSGQANREKTVIEKNEIRKRLEELRINARKIMTKSIKKKKFAPRKGPKEVPEGVGSPSSHKKDIVRRRPSESRIKKNLKKQIDEFENEDDKLSVEVHRPEQKKSIKKKTDTKQPSDFNAIASVENQKRIGLLRKLETKDHSFSAIKEFIIDKENVVLNMTQPEVEEPLESIIPDLLNEKKDLTEMVTKNDEPDLPNVIVSQDQNANDLDIQEQKIDKEKQPKTVNEKRSDLPYWLRPSAVQVYPYNFIVAVRKKLESLSKAPAFVEERSGTNKKNEITSTSDLRLIKKGEDITFPKASKVSVFGDQQNVESRIIAKVDEEEKESDRETFYTHTIDSKNRLPSQISQLSDIHSDFSSISLQLQASNTISELSSLHSVSKQTSQVKSQPNFEEEDDNTTVSSSIFNSPQKKIKERTKSLKHFDFAAPRPVSPLSLEHIDKLKIKTQPKLEKNVFVSCYATQQHADDLEILNLQATPNEFDFNKLLDDFNRSLSHVIQVNDQLKSTIDKSNHICNSGSQKISATITEELRSTDFENSDSYKDANNTSGSSNINKRDIKKKSEEEKRNIIDGDKPYLTSPKSDAEINVNDPVKISDLFLKLDSMENTSSNSLSSDMIDEEIRTQNYDVNEELAQEPFEKRLDMIEELKANLKESILKSKAQRIIETRKHKHSSELKMEESKINVENTERIQNSFSNKTETNCSVKGMLQENGKNSNLIKKANDILKHVKTASELLQNSNTSGSVEADSPKVNIKTSVIDDEILYTSDFTSKSISENLQTDKICTIKKNEDEASHSTADDSTQAAYMSVHINSSRGDLQTKPDERELNFQAAVAAAKNTASDTTSASCPSNNGKKSQRTTLKKQLERTQNHNSVSQSTCKSAQEPTAIGSEIVAIFNQSDLELSQFSSNDASHTDSSQNYSSIGMYEKLIQNETTKSEHLTMLLKIREKALLDRTKGQIAWLEVQKERYKSKGLLMQITAIKKKQRGILLKMEKERDEIKRLLQSTTPAASTQSSTRPNIATLLTPTKRKKHHASRQPCITDGISRTHSTSAPQEHRPVPIVRANYELQTSRPVEELLQKREEDLRRRREHVERLMQWHKRLDDEEAEVQQLERMLLNYNNGQRKADSSTKSKNLPPQTPKKILPKKHHAADMERRIKEIDQSLLELSSISSTAASAHDDTCVDDEGSVDFVRTTGSKLNKLWRRLTSQQVEKFESNRRYKLCKADLSALYEEAKVAVLHEFAKDDECITIKLFEKSTTSHKSNSSSDNGSNSRVENVPYSNMNSNRTQSDDGAQSEHQQQPQKLVAVSSSLSQGNYSPSAAEEDFNMHLPTNDKGTNESERDKRIEGNIHRFLSCTQRLVQQHSSGLQRSLSETHISQNSPFHSSRITTTTSQRNVSDAMQKSSTANRTVRSKESVGSVGSASTDASLPDTLKDVQSLIANTVLSSRELENFTLSATEQWSNDSKIETKYTNTLNVVLNHTENPIESFSNVSQVSESSQKTHQGSVQKTEDEDYEIKSVIESLSPKNLSIISDNVVEADLTSETTDNAFSISSDIISNLNSRELVRDLTAEKKVESQLCLPSYRVIKNSAERSPCDVKNVSSITITEGQNQITDDKSSNSYQFDNISNDLHSPSSGSLKSIPSCTSAETVSDDKNYARPSTSAYKTFICTQNVVLDTYEADFESLGDETCIEDLSLPHFETTNDETLEGEEEVKILEKSSSCNNNEIVSAQNTNETSLSICSGGDASADSVLAENEKDLSSSSIPTQNQAPSTNGQQLMPDIINELEIRRCQQILENENLKQIEHINTAFMFVREIPNKPPPPYVPPAHGSPMTTIFPSEERIKDITFRRTHELFCEISKTEYTNDEGEMLPSVMTEKITNIYERIILDICREYLIEHSEVLTQGDPNNFHSQLAFFNPPDRLRCLQASVFKEVRCCLAMNKTPPKRTPVYSVYGQRARRDHIGKIIIQEMYDDDMWCNFRREENEVLELIFEEMIGENVGQLAKATLLAEGGSIEKEEQKEYEEYVVNNDERNVHHDDNLEDAAIDMTANPFFVASPKSSSVNDAETN